MRGELHGTRSGGTFNVSSGNLSCAGNWGGSISTTYTIPVLCNDGRSGVLSGTRGGGGGRGEFTLNDGVTGHFVYGPGALKIISQTDSAIKSKPRISKRPSPKKSPPPSSGSTGSGFFVSKLGHIVTNEHVVRKCGSVTVGDNANKQVAASVLEKDKRNDLALLRISSTQMASAETKSLISKLGLKLVPLASEGLFKSEDVELGEDVLVAGFPHGDFYSDGIKVTKGIVSGKKGMGDDRGQFQMDAAVQKGNSGGPIYDENGNIVGVVVSQLDPLKVAKAIGSLPQNVNFGIKASTVRQFLNSAGIPTKWSNRTQRKSFREVAQIADKQTVMVVCNP